MPLQRSFEWRKLVRRLSALCKCALIYLWNVGHHVHNNGIYYLMYASVGSKQSDVINAYLPFHSYICSHSPHCMPVHIIHYPFMASCLCFPQLLSQIFVNGSSNEINSSSCTKTRKYILGADCWLLVPCLLVRRHSSVNSPWTHSQFNQLHAVARDFSSWWVPAPRRGRHSVVRGRMK